MKKLYSGLLMALWSLAFCHLSSAQDLIYEAKNPAFGGNTFNHQWLLADANAQNDTEEEKDPLANLNALNSQDPLTQFKNQLNQQILSELSRRIVRSQFGDEGIQEGQFAIGNFQIDVTEGSDGVNISVLDINTGNSTTVVVPFTP